MRNKKGVKMPVSDNSDGPWGSGGKKKSSGKTIGLKFKTALQGLAKTLRKTQPHYIRCVKPNQLKRPHIFEGSRTLEQLRYSGVFEATQIRQKGYPFRSEYDVFLQQHRAANLPQLTEAAKQPHNRVGG